MDKKVTGIIGYITLIGWIIAYLTGDKEGAKFHLNQALVLNLCSIVISVASRVFHKVFLFNMILGLCGIVFFVFWIMGLIAAVKDEEKELPFIGSIKILK